MRIDFKKYQGTGNDFIAIDNRKEVFPEKDKDLITRLCDRRFGIGSDGLILIKNSALDFEMVFFNPDASQSLCGNGSRCAVHYAKELGMAKEEGEFITTDGAHSYKFNPDQTISISMRGVPEKRTFGEHIFIDTGSPHLIVRKDNLSDLDIISEGRALRHSPEFEALGGTNVNFVKKLSHELAEVRTYERGVEGETLSCGTGVTAVALALSNSEAGLQIRHLRTKGGQLTVQFELTDEGFRNIWLSGPVEQVFEGSINA